MMGEKKRAFEKKKKRTSESLEMEWRGPRVPTSSIMTVAK
jgi:hypothetical protein